MRKLDNDFTVTVNYYSRADQSFVTQSYGFNEYTEMLKVGLMRILTDVEDAFYRFNDERPPEEWDEKSAKEFAHIRRKILDQANAIARLPETTRCKGLPIGSRSLSDLIAQALSGDDDVK